jgi:drug/metabolite transporter (DMT)-like permease
MTMTPTATTMTAQCSPHDDEQQQRPRLGRRTTTTYLAVAVVYVCSGICQPLLMTKLKSAGLADSAAQLYMFFYYAGPSCLLSLVVPPLWADGKFCGCGCGCFLQRLQRNCVGGDGTAGQPRPAPRSISNPSASTLWRAAAIAIFDITAQSLNYTGAGLAGATIFAVVYSSVTVWTAIFSRLFLRRSLPTLQWVAVAIVCAGLCITVLDSSGRYSSSASSTTSTHIASNDVDSERILRGTLLMLCGSCMHGATYVLSEAIMKRTSSGTAAAGAGGDGDGGTATARTSRDFLLPLENAVVQGLVASVGLLLWQVVYTIPRWTASVVDPMRTAGTTVFQAAILYGVFALANLFHSLSFYHTLAHYPGGSTSAGVMKALQAVLVFAAAHFLYCSAATPETCFTWTKGLSLLTVAGGVVLFGRSAKDVDSAPEVAGYTAIGPVTNDTSISITRFPTRSVEFTL